MCPDEDLVNMRKASGFIVYCFSDVKLTFSRSDAVSFYLYDWLGPQNLQIEFLFVET